MCSSLSSEGPFISVISISHNIPHMPTKRTTMLRSHSWQDNRSSEKSGFPLGGHTQEINVLLCPSRTNAERIGYLFQGIVRKGYSFDLSMNLLSGMELEGR